MITLVFVFVLVNIFNINIVSAHHPKGIPKQNIIIQEPDTYKRNIKLDAAIILEGKRDIVVAVIDTGVDLNHSDLKSHLVPGSNFVNSDVLPQDDHGHGTQLAGIISSIGNFEGDFVKIMPIKVLDFDAKGEIKNLIRGIEHAIDNNANVILLSLRINTDNEEIRDLLQLADSKNIILISSNGNGGGTVSLPGSYPEVIATGGITSGFKKHPLSNYGNGIKVMAPFHAYTTTLHNNYTYVSGTSFSAAQVAGLTSIFWSRYPELSNYQVRDYIYKSAEDIGDLGWDFQTGFGLIQADKLFQLPRNDIFTYFDEGILPYFTTLYGNIDATNTSDMFYVRGGELNRTTIKIKLVGNTKGLVSFGSNQFNIDKELSIQLPSVKLNTQIIISKNGDVEAGSLEYLISVEEMKIHSGIEDNVIINGVYYSPLRSTLEEINYKVEWNEKTKLIYIQNKYHTLILNTYEFETSKLILLNGHYYVSDTLLEMIINFQSI
jgi:hypothetical protein